MNVLRAGFLLIPMLIFLAGCAATTPVKAEKAGKKEIAVVPAEKPDEKGGKLPGSFADRELLLEGIAILNRPGPQEQAAARKVFDSLLQNHPRSQWRTAAETFIRLIDEGNTSRETLRQEHVLLERMQGERAKALHENDFLKKTVRDLTEKLQTETAALSQENERLKSDLQRLKALEIELQKRERMLR